MSSEAFVGEPSTGAETRDIGELEDAYHLERSDQ